MRSLRSSVRPCFTVSIMPSVVVDSAPHEEHVHRSDHFVSFIPNRLMFLFFIRSHSQQAPNFALCTARRALHSAPTDESPSLLDMDERLAAHGENQVLFTVSFHISASISKPPISCSFNHQLCTSALELTSVTLPVVYS